MNNALKIHLRVFILLLAGLLPTGCALILPKVDPAGYEGRGLDYTGVDFTVLEGKQIVIDPGHGGRWSGAVGKKGLAEKDVNLAVAQILKNLLTEYGARVVMTREGDTDLVPEGSQGTLHDDLAARVDSANSHPDIDFFLSIHHNNLGLPNSRYNATETYFRMGDYGPSLDLARYLHRQLVRNVGLPKNSIRPGNYYVLRNNRHPAVLGEASYLSHSGTEKKLAGEAARQIEAYSYLLGIVDYLSGGVPVVEGLRLVGGNPVQDPWPQFEARVYDEPTGRGIDPQQLEFTLDGRPLEASYDPAGGTLRARPADALANGLHRAAVRVRNLRGNAAREAVLEFAVAVPPSWIRLRSSLSTIPLDGRTPVRFTAVAGDEWGRSVADGTEVFFQFSDPNLEARAVTVHGGQASLTVTPAANRELIAEASCGDLTTRISVPVGEPLRNVLVVRTEEASGGAPLGDVIVSLPGAGAFVTSPDGYLSIEGIPAGEPELRFEKSGYLPETVRLEIAGGRSFLSYVRMKPAAGGVLIGKRIAIDPAAGLDDPGTVGPDGTGEAEVNLSVARLLGDYLARAGAQVFYTRAEQDAPGVWERAARAESFGAQVLISFSHGGAAARKGPPPATVVHFYPGSTEGERLARVLAAGLNGFAGRPAAGAGPGYERIIQQVSCPAVWVRAASLADPAAEKLLARPAVRRAEAQAVFAALLRYFGWEPQDGGPIAGRVSDGRGEAVEGALVTLDGWYPAQTDATGRFLFTGLDGTSHTIEVLHRGKAYGGYSAAAGRNLEILLGSD